MTRPGEKVVHSSQGTVAQARKPLEQVCSLECFRLGEKSFAQAMRYSRPGEIIFAQAKIDFALWTTFAQAIIFFARAKLVSPKLKKNFFFFLLFVSECLALWNAMYVFSKTN